MKTIFPSLSSLFVTWASAGQYGEVAEIDATGDEAPAAPGKVHTLASGNRKKAVGGVQQFGVSVGEPKYIDGSMLVKRKIA
ncbi:MAG: hypothetical protein JWQ90_3291 [Hydrocarboniphaga sp.]|uniref:hypothetical protein n=1 Tax=Hydrocarboniphaga sp. TaxID=2033016 RepID=UPI002629CF2B|nr:hypothetical protein [Hydrocarboniphaga sp.]MDB5970841.1 hypothetical protein [Hydrocarboniphaga sp.]